VQVLPVSHLGFFAGEYVQRKAEVHLLLAKFMGIQVTVGDGVFDSNPDSNLERQQAT
jgi:hypothetical protein